MDSREHVWHSENDNTRELMEMVEDQLQHSAGHRRWRLAISTFARRALEQTGVGFEQPLLDMLEDWVDGLLPLEDLRSAYERQLKEGVRPRLETAVEWARAAALTAANPNGMPVHLFDTLYWQQAQNAFPDPTAEEVVQAVIFKDIFGNPFRPVVFDSRWRSESAVALARTAYDTRNFTLLPILADALEEAGCDQSDVLTHCRDPHQVHVRGCWVLDGVLGKE